MRRTAFPVAAAAWLVLAANAWAGSAVSLSPSLVVGEENAGEKNDLVLSEFSGKYRVGEIFAIPMTGGTGCIPAGGDVDCDTFQIDNVAVIVHGNNDTVQTSIGLPASLFGGAGQDDLYGGPDNDLLYGNTGDDSTYGGNGADQFIDGDNFFGASGNDDMHGGNGNDLFDGGDPANTGMGQDDFFGDAEIDTLDFSERTTPLTITEGDGQANDGAAGEGDEVVNAEIILLGSGSDRATGASGANTLDGRAGADVLNGAGGDDQLLGGSGNDALTGGANADSLSGGLGTDSASYTDKTQPVTVTVGDGANDGTSGEKDDVQVDVETLLGGGAGDNFTGDDGANTISALGGDDRVTGAGGDDSLNGGDARDQLLGGSGNDRIDGGRDRDRVKAGSGDDRVKSRDRTRDRIACGTGIDRVVADLIDRVARSCERVRRR